MPSGYRVKTVVRTSGERLPVLLDRDGQPMFASTVFALTEVRGRNLAANTIGIVLRSVMAFHLFLALLDQLPKLLAGYGKTPGMDAVVVVLDSDRRDCKAFLGELKALLQNCRPVPNTLFRLAIEEMEAWFLGDRQALLAAYPRAKRDVLSRYQQDSVCGTWEMLADAVYPGGSAAIRKAGWPLPGQIKHEWAERIGPRMCTEDNQSPSFCKFRDGLRRLVAT